MSLLLTELDGWEGFTPARAMTFTPVQMQRGLDLLRNAGRLRPHQHEYQLKEVITTSQFPYLFGQILERMILARYRAAVGAWRAWTALSSLRDFRQAEKHKVYGNDNDLPLVAEKGEYLVSPHGNAHYHQQVFKRGRQLDISWEALINDTMNAMGDIPSRFATAAIRTDARLVAGLYSSATGPNALLYGIPIVDVDGQNVTNRGTLALTIANLQTTLSLMTQQVDPNGMPILVRGAHLVVPPALEFTMRTILSSALVQWTEVGAGGGIPVPTTNVIPQYGIQGHVDPMLPVVDVSANIDTTWYLFAEPSEGAAIEFATLRGHESPEICMKASNKVAVGGGMIDPFAGDFATDNIFYRIRHVIGGTQLDPRYTYAQIGTT